MIKERPMNGRFSAAMLRATKATRAFNVLGATRIIQKTLAKSVLSRLSFKASTVSAGVLKKQNQPKTNTPAKTSEVPSRAPLRLRRPLGEVVNTLQASTRLAVTGFQKPLDKVQALPIPAGARFVTRSFTSSAGSREYKLYVPASALEKSRGLIIMLHGCTQNPDDFAAGTNMNAIAETHGLLIAYPAQTRANNPSSCWNWFETNHQLRDRGEPAILAGLTQRLIEEFEIRDDHVFVAGLSAGGAMAVIMGATYPDIYRAVGVHSGLAYQSAGNIMSALAVMRGSAGSSLFGKVQSRADDSEPMRTIIFHGSADRTVHPSNAERISTMARTTGNADAIEKTTASVNGRRFTKTVVANAKGEFAIESWLIQGAGHAWSGGKPNGSYTDIKGPDASAEMARFFLNLR
jgi:poly(hydroxyalkanoate) depolymerase family esterase